MEICNLYHRYGFVFEESRNHTGEWATPFRQIDDIPIPVFFDSHKHARLALEPLIDSVLSRYLFNLWVLYLGMEGEPAPVIHRINQ